jgi:hypothetical protein
MTDLMSQRLNLNADPLKVVESLRNLTLLAIEFHNHHALFSRIDTSP